VGAWLLPAQSAVYRTFGEISMRRENHPFVQLLSSAGALAVLAAALVLCGCERKEKVIDVETPGADVEVTRDKDTGRIDIEVDRKK
jgi:hypothetical protein